MERNDTGVCEVIAPPSPPDLRPSTRRGTQAPIRRPVTLRPQLARPLPAGYRLPFFAPFCYSPRGTSPVAGKSRMLRDLVKRGDPAMLARCIGRLTTLIARGAGGDFLNADAVLVPVPRSIPYDPCAPRSVPEAIATALVAAGLGKIVWPALRRARAIPRSSWSRPGSRPEFLLHYRSLELVDNQPPSLRFLLVDDFVTRGRTVLAAAAALHRAFPGAQLGAFALVRTEGLCSDIAAIAAPTIGIIRYLGGDAFRSP